ncbi:hypothetical protein CR513_21084, partial [Mucuna pruriens]
MVPRRLVCTLRDLLNPSGRLSPSIIRPLYMQIHLKSTGYKIENPNAHLETFLEICNVGKINGVRKDVNMDEWCETLYKACDKYQELLRKCLSHDFDELD